jgi:uncharacterized protein
MIQLESLPPVAWQPEPQSWTYTDEVLSATAAKKTDLFTDPLGKGNSDNAAKLLFEAQQDFILSACVNVDFADTFDAGVLTVYQHPTSWAKLCFERSPQGSPMIVSVVTKGTSDDCNSVFIDSDSVYLRICKIGNSFAFHYSIDSSYWHMIRVFALEPVPTQAGFLVQSPIGDGCDVQFSDIAYKKQTLNDIRSGE